MSGVVNLRQARKQKKREASRADAALRAAEHGEAKPARALRDAQRALENRRIEGHRREPEG